MAEDKSTAAPVPAERGKWREGLFIAFSLIVSGAVAYVTGKGSWMHIVHIGHTVGEPSADWLPVAIDGMMLNGTILVAVDRFRKRVARPWAVISLWLGSILTLVFNIASAWERGIAAMLIAVMYAVALLCTVEAVFHPSQTTIEEAMERRAARRSRKLAANAAQTLAPQAPPVVAVAVDTPEVPAAPVTVAPVPAQAAKPKPPRGRRAAPRTTPRGPVQSTRKGAAAKTAPADVQETTVPAPMGEPTVVTFSDTPAATPGSARVVADMNGAMATVEP
jgi:hypothetical protein